MNPVRVVALLGLFSFAAMPQARADGPKRLHKVELHLDVTWAGARGIQIPIVPGSTELLKGQCPPVIEINPHFDPPDEQEVSARYTLSDGRVLDRKQKVFMASLYTEQWNIPIQDVGQTFKGSVTLHINTPDTDQNDVTVPFTVACAPKLEPGAQACDNSGDTCHQGKQLGVAVRTEISAERPPLTWSGGTPVPGTYVLTAMKQYTYEGMKVTDADETPGQATAIVKKAGTGITVELVTTEGTCTQRSTIAATPDPKAPPGAIVPAYEPVFSGSHAMLVSQTCPPSVTPGGGLPAAYSVTPSGFTMMLFTGTVLTFTRKQ